MPYIRKTDDIFISDKLKFVLMDIQDSSIIAKLLLKPRHSKEDLKEEFVNYLDISEADHTKISYLTQDRMDKITDGINPFEYNRRFMARPAAVVNKIFKGIKDKDLEIFNNLYKSSLTRMKFTFKIVSGESIRPYYLGDNYRSCSGTLGNSCMKYDNCQKYFGLYIDNPEVVTMLAMVDDDGYLMGRALLWNFDSYKVMDRIYTINDEELAFQFKKWAVDNGYMYKHEQKWNNTLVFEMGGKKVDQKFSIQLKNWKFDRYPYMDTFKFLDKKTGILYNYLEHDNIRTLCASDGAHFDSDFLAHDFTNNLFYHRGETVSIHYKDGKRIQNSTLRVYSPHAVWSKVNDLYIIKSDSIYLDDIDDYVFSKDLDHLNDKESIEKYKKRIEEQNRRRLEERKIRESELSRLIAEGVESVETHIDLFRILRSGLTNMEQTTEFYDRNIEN